MALASCRDRRSGSISLRDAADSLAPKTGRPAPYGCATAISQAEPAASPRGAPCGTGTARSKGQEYSVIDKIGFLVRFWELRARHATVGEPLSGREQVELLSLMQLITTDFRLPEPGTCARPSDALPAQLIGEGTILPVEVRHVCAAALLVASTKSMSPAERVIIRLADSISGVEYALPCSIAWVYDASPCIMALTVDGIPTRSEFAVMPEPRVGSVLPMGRPVRLVS
jgi:hypothetical protein